MIDAALQLAAAGASAVILWRAEPALNRMRPGTHLMIRVALYLLVIGAVAQLGGVVLGQVPSLATVIVLAGVAVLMVFERRLRELLPPPDTRPFQ